ncbi:uncharacterized protein LOC124272427 isoform X1 [Haliotis rubra]|uniref:uncharacterized protein LOC124272427 isoform X1 n=1 Tax=Haliotis rubra TaxID=36100 RepID=UPI001EE60194|nr:uncharacterized protein LOC124272427 isoform X1 [Haliotis rubra]
MIMLVTVDILAICLLTDDSIGTIDTNNGKEIEMEIGTYGTIPDATDGDTLEENKPMCTTDEAKDELFSSDDEADPKSKYKYFFCSENKMDEHEIDDDKSNETVKFNRDTDLLISGNKNDVSEEHDQKDPSINTCYSFPDSKLNSECEPSEQIYRSDADLSNYDDKSSPSSSASSSDNVLKENIPLMTQRMSEHVPILKLLKTASFHAVLWIISLSMATDTIVYSNIPVITQSVNLQYFDTPTMITSRVCICGSALFSGIFYNYFNDQRSIYTVMFAAVSALLLANTMLLISTEHPAILIIAAGLIGSATGVMWVLGAGLVLTAFGHKDYGRNWGFVIMVSFIVSECLTPIIGKMYDAKVAQSDSNVCYGGQCTRQWFILLLGGLIVSFVLCIWQLITSWKKAV